MNLHLLLPTKDFVMRVFAQQYHLLPQVRFAVRQILLKQSLSAQMPAMLLLLLLLLWAAICAKLVIRGKCNWGIATQRPELTRRLNPEIAHQRVINLINAWNHEIKEIMGGMGINSIDSLRGNRLMLRGIGLSDKELEILGIKHAGE